uniref:Rne/Rng family ribonuclease n=1 Tax=Pararhizobium sp. IMCC3301 TaxID=3067904 RepID=UPI0027419097|nr:ribonuclease E/G [Pararhizobium sp. IMCC3301]
MANKMLIDASHPEETRVAVVKGNRVEEFDFEAANRVQLRGNIYLAKVTRVEPSLQAAFVDYGGNRHGFLAFSEIHPDYYQIPIADRQALLEEEAADEIEAKESSDSDIEKTAAENAAGDASDDSETDSHTKAESTGSGSRGRRNHPADEDDDNTGKSDDGDDSPSVESVGAEDAMEEVPERRRPRRRQYKIQEVIKRRQVLLVQVVKEERGNKGAAMTTYLSLAGRYSVLMPNTARGGGISRKITNPADRKRLKSVANSLEVAPGMGVILRTAGANRTKPEIKRDFEYLLRLWENVRTLTLQSSAPCLVYEEGSLVKRSIRDLYSKDIDEIQVAGEAGYREAKDFMKMLMPSHAKNVKPYREEKSLFTAFGIEPQLDAMFSPQVTLKSGGYLVINPTEALVSVDVNSGKSTREHNIEDTAVQTNLEAAEEVARQLRLRDLAGLIVIDFIDMDERRNNNSVERKLKDCLKSDRARIQVGRISPFGLMEMSRQRIRTGVLESTTVVCEHCEGTGYVRSPASISLQVLRGLEDHLAKHSSNNVSVRVRAEVALYILNQKRAHLTELEVRYGVQITVDADSSVTMQGFNLEKGERSEGRSASAARAALVSVDSIEPVEEDEDLAEAEAEDEVEAEADVPEQDDEPKRKRRRRRRKRGGNTDQTAAQDPATDAAADAASETSESSDAEEDDTDDSEDNDGQPRKRRRGKRGGRRNRRKRNDGEDNAEAASEESGNTSETSGADGGEPDAESSEDLAATEVPAPEADDENADAKKPKPRRARKPRAKKSDAPQPDADSTPALAAETVTADFVAEEPVVEEEQLVAAGSEPIKAAETDAPTEAQPGADLPIEDAVELVVESTAVPAVELAPEPPEVAAPKRSGWWRRR